MTASKPSLPQRIADAVTGAASPPGPPVPPSGRDIGPLIQRLNELPPDEPVTLPASAARPPALPAQTRTPPPTMDVAAPVPDQIRPEPIKAIFPYDRERYLYMALGMTGFARLTHRAHPPDFKVETLIAVAEELLRTYGIVHALHARIAAIRKDGETPRHQGDINLCLGCLQSERQIKDRLHAIEKRLEGRGDG